MSRGVETAFAVIQPGLEGVLERELRTLGIRFRVDTGGAEFPATTAFLHAVHLHARTPTRVWVRLGSFEAGRLEVLARGIRALPWSRFVHRRQPLSLRVTTLHSRLRFRRAIAAKAERAIGDALKGQRPRRGPALPAASVLIRVVDDRVEVSVDATGDPLYRRGWRVDVGSAPLRETLAAAVLQLAGWQADRPLVDPMCGSGTFCIEAATIAAGRPPGGARRFAFEAWPSHDPKAWARARRTGSGGGGSAPILGGDRDATVLAAARRNADRARVGDRIRFVASDVADLRPPGGRGLIVANPPWGERLADGRRGFEALGRALPRFAGWRIAVLAPRPAWIRSWPATMDPPVYVRAGGLRIAVCVGRVDLGPGG